MRSTLLSLIGIASLLLSCSESVQPSISGSPAKPPVADMDDATMTPPGSDGDVQDMPDMAPVPSPTTTELLLLLLVVDAAGCINPWFAG